MTLFRNATSGELAQILGWASEEGWNTGVDDTASFHDADPNGFFVAVDNANDLVGAIAVVNHTPEFAFLGLYIVRPEFRGRGIGFALWNHALKHAGVRTVGLFGVAAQQANYRRSGFVTAGGTIRFTGPVTGQPQHEIRAAEPSDLLRLIEMEGHASGVAKPAYISGWFTGAETRKTFVLETRGDIEGCATVRVCQSGAKIGPLIAKTADVAHKLILHAASVFDGPVTLDVPDTGTALIQLCQDLGLEAGFQTALMFRGVAPKPFPTLYAVASLELG